MAVDRACGLESFSQGRRGCRSAVPDTHTWMLARRWGMGIESQMRAMLTEAIPRQHMSPSRAVNAPPQLRSRDEAVLGIADAERSKLTNGRRSWEANAHPVYQSMLSAAATAWATSPPLRSHSTGVSARSR